MALYLYTNDYTNKKSIVGTENSDSVMQFFIIMVIMKNTTLEKNANQTSEFVNQKIDLLLFEQKQNKKTKSKLIKGKVKVFSNSNRLKFINNEILDDETELVVISERIIYFLKFTLLFLILIAFFIFLKRNI